MHKLLIAALSLVLSAPFAWADAGGSGSAKPVFDTEEASTGFVQQDASNTDGYGQNVLKSAEVRDVDLNRDGKVSFSELFVHDFASDF